MNIACMGLQTGVLHHRLRKHHPLACEPVEIRSQDGIFVHEPKRLPPHLVGHHDNEIRMLEGEGLVFRELFGACRSQANVESDGQNPNQMLERNLGCPEISDYIFQEDLTPEQVITGQSDIDRYSY